MQDNQEKCKELAIRIYNLDEEVYKCVGSSLGRTFTENRNPLLHKPFSRQESYLPSGIPSSEASDTA